MELEQLKFLAQLSVVSLLRLLLAGQPLLQRLLVEEGGAINALQHGVAVVAAPVGPATGKQLDDANFAGGRAVWAQAEVHPVAVPVEGKRLRPLGDDVLHNLHLEGLTLALEEANCLVGGDFGADEGKVLPQLLVGRLLDVGQVLGSEGRLAKEVVVETVLDGGADGDLRSGEQLLHHTGHHVSGIVSDGVQRLGSLGG